MGSWAENNLNEPLRDPNMHRESWWYFDLDKKRNEGLDPGEKVDRGPVYHYSETHDMTLKTLSRVLDWLKTSLAHVIQIDSLVSSMITATILLRKMLVKVHIRPQGHMQVLRVIMPTEETMV